MGGPMGRAEGSEYGDEAAESGNRDEHDVPAARIEQEAVKQGLHGRAHVGAEVQAARRRAGEEAAAYVGGKGPCRAVDGIDAEARHEEQYLDEHELPHHSGVEQEEHVHGHGTDSRIVGAGPEAVVQVQLVAEPRHYQRTYAHTHGKRERGEQAVGNFDTELVDEIQRYPRHKAVAGKAYGEGHYHPQVEKPVGKHVLIGVELALGAQYFLHGRFVLRHLFRVFRVFVQADRAGRRLGKDHVDDEHGERYGRRHDESRTPAHFRQNGKGQRHGQRGRHLPETRKGVGKAGGEAARVSGPPLGERGDAGRPRHGLEEAVDAPEHGHGENGRLEAEKDIGHRRKQYGKDHETSRPDDFRKAAVHHLPYAVGPEQRTGKDAYVGLGPAKFGHHDGAGVGKVQAAAVQRAVQEREHQQVAPRVTLERCEVLRGIAERVCFYATHTYRPL